MTNNGKKKSKEKRKENHQKQHSQNVTKKSHQKVWKRISIYNRMFHHERIDLLTPPPPSPTPKKGKNYCNNHDNTLSKLKQSDKLLLGYRCCIDARKITTLSNPSNLIKFVKNIATKFCFNFFFTVTLSFVLQHHHRWELFKTSLFVWVTTSHVDLAIFLRRLKKEGSLKKENNQIKSNNCRRK